MFDAGLRQVEYRFLSVRILAHKETQTLHNKQIYQIHALVQTKFPTFNFKTPYLVLSTIIEARAPDVLRSAITTVLH